MDPWKPCPWNEGVLIRSRSPSLGKKKAGRNLSASRLHDARARQQLPRTAAAFTSAPADARSHLRVSGMSIDSRSPGGPTRAGAQDVRLGSDGVSRSQVVTLRRLSGLTVVGTCPIVCS